MAQSKSKGKKKKMGRPAALRGSNFYRLVSGKELQDRITMVVEAAKLKEVNLPPGEFEQSLKTIRLRGCKL